MFVTFGDGMWEGGGCVKTSSKAEKGVLGGMAGGLCSIMIEGMLEDCQPWGPAKSDCSAT